MAALSPTKRGRGVRLRKSGKWGAAIPSFPSTPPVFRKPKGTILTKLGKWKSFINHPITKIKLYLGTYDTPQEAGEVYTKKKLEFESMYPSAGKLEERKSSKWYAVYQDPITRCTSYLGTYGSAEAATQALYRNKPGFHSIAIDEKQPVLRKRKGITLLKSGKWKATIPHPVTSVSVFLGIYDTPQEAGDAYDKQKLEFESMFPNVSKKERSPSKWYAVIQDPMTGCTTYLGTYGTAEEAAEARYRKMREFESMGMQMMQSNAVHEQEVALACISEAGNSKITVANCDSSKECGMDVENGEMPALRSVIEEKFDMGVIDAYGQFIGEFSRMDDELWFV